MRLALSLFLIVAPMLPATDAPDLGEQLKLKEDSGRLAFGVTYSLGAEDPDGNNYLLNFTKEGGPLAKGTKWNVYLSEKKAFAFSEWKVSDSEVGAWSIRLDDKNGARDVLPHQTKMILVFETPDGTKFHLDLGKMCLDPKLKSHFKNLTNDKLCKDIKPEDLGKNPANASGTPRANRRQGQRGTHGGK